jgi:cysteine synthase A
VVDGSSISQGIGSTRITANFGGTPIDDAAMIPDQECADMVYRRLREEGLFVGGSSGINVAAAARIAKVVGPGNCIVTLLCDIGGRYLPRLIKSDWLRGKGLNPPL